MNMDQIERQTPLYEHSHDFQLMHNLYESAVKQLTLKFEVLYARNPIHHIESRVKSAASIAAKLRKKGLPLTIEAARESVNDIAGVRVVCSYIDDVYRVAEMLERQKDVEIIKRQDYIRTPNYNGYRSLHLDSLEHDIRYKADKSRLPAGINEEMFACADKIAEIDQQMQDMYQRIKASEQNHD